MFVEDDHGPPLQESDLPVKVDPTALLAACAAEAARLATGLRQLDAALGAALVLAQRPNGPAPPPGTGAGADASEARTLISALASDLQQADRLRQEADGLAQTLSLLVNRPKSAGPLTADQVRGCTPVLDLQRRLLSQGA